MANLGGDFDANRIEPAQPFEVLPAGRYLVQLVDSDKRMTKDGKGEYLWLEFEILDADREGLIDGHKGRKLWDRLNLWNPNTTAVEIAERAMAALCHAAGKLVVSDSTELHHIPVIATVRVRPRDGAYDESNEIRGYAAPAGRAPTRVAPAPGAPAQAAMPITAPWKGRRA